MYGVSAIHFTTMNDMSMPVSKASLVELIVKATNHTAQALTLTSIATLYSFLKYYNKSYQTVFGLCTNTVLVCLSILNLQAINIEQCKNLKDIMSYDKLL